MQDFAYFKSLYPAACKQMQLCVEAVCDELEYEGSPIYDEYPDRIFLEKLTKRALEKWQKGYPHFPDCISIYLFHLFSCHQTSHFHSPSPTA